MKKNILIMLLIILCAFTLYADSSIIKKLYIPLFNSNGVSLNSLSNLSSSGTISSGIGSEPNSSTLSPGGNYLYVSNRSGRSISIIDTSSDTVVSTISLYDSDIVPTGIVFDSSNNSLIIGTYFHETFAPYKTTKAGLWVIYLKDNLTEEISREQICTEKLIVYNCCIYGNKIYYAVYGTSKLRIYDKETKQTKEFDLSSINTSAKNFYLTNLSPNGKWLIITNVDANGQAVLVDLSTINKQTPTIKLLGNDALYADFSFDSNYVYYTTRNTSRFYVCPVDNFKFDTKTGLDMNGSMLCYTFGCSEDGNYAYVLSYGDASGNTTNKGGIYKIDIPNFKVVATSNSVQYPYVAGGFLPSNAALVNSLQLKRLKTEAMFDYQGRGGENFFIPITKNKSINYAAFTSPLDYDNWDGVTKTAVTNWNSKVLNPTSLNDEFQGWYTDINYTTPADFDSPLTEGTVFYAKWKIHTHQYSFYSKDNILYAYCNHPSEDCNIKGKDKAVSIEPKAGALKVLKTTILPENATNKELLRSSSNEKVVKFDENGLLHALTAGNAIVTSKSTDGSNITGTCVITVVE